MATTVFTAIIEKEGELYAALCPELDVASQGTSVEEATANLREAVEQVTENAGESAARLEHGFESRWDHEVDFVTACRRRTKTSVP